MTTSTLIAEAVEPLRADAIARAEQRVRNWVDRVEAELDAVGNDLQAYAPRPRGTDADYREKMHRHNAASAITSPVNTRGFRRPGDPEIVKIDPAKIARRLQAAAQEASASFDAYVAKLAGKVGAVTAAAIDGRNLWDGSTLTVTQADGTVARWYTQQIVNVSSLGTVFNQWPTRRRK